MSETPLTEAEREVLRIKAARSGMDSVILYVERLIAAKVSDAEAELASLKANIRDLVADYDCGYENGAKAERERITAAVEALPVWKVPHPVASKVVDPMVLVCDLRAALAQPTATDGADQ